MEDLEKQFRDAVAACEAELKDPLKRASDALTEAEEISEKHGIPFYSPISFLSQKYCPTTFATQWGEIDEELREELDVYPNEYGAGWQHSAVCY